MESLSSYTVISALLLLVAGLLGWFSRAHGRSLKPRPGIHQKAADSKSPSEARTPKSVCVRIAGVPSGTDSASLQAALKGIDATFDAETQLHSLSLYPACNGDSQVALCELDSRTGLVALVPQSGAVHIRTAIDGEETLLNIDRQLYDLTPLNSPEGEIFADVVAVTGLSGHAFGSWKSRATGHMWLKDFLPQDVKGLRVMSYGYNSNLVGDTVKDRFLEYRKRFIHSLLNARQGNEKRPLIFIGHSMGGILILQALLHCKNGHQYRELFEATHGVYFFGAPHNGMEVEQILAMIQDQTEGESSQEDFVRQLQVDSNFLTTQREDIVGLWDSGSNVEILSFYETKMTATVAKSEDGAWKRTGKEIQAVQKSSAQLFWSFEHRIPVSANHTDIVKFPSSEDGTYNTVVRYLNGRVERIAQEHRAAKLTLLDEHIHCLRSLTQFDCETYRETILLKKHENTCTWLFDDPRYKAWNDGDSPVLWIHAGPGSGKSVLSSVISKELTSDDRDALTAYFFFDDKDDRIRTAQAALQNLLAQILKQDPSGVYKHFLEESEFAINGSSTAWSFGMLWRVLVRVINDETLRPLTLVIDALDECDQSQELLLKHLSHFFRDNNSAVSRVKIIATSRPQVELDSYFPGLIQIALDSDLSRQDITNYITAEASSFPAALREEILETLTTGADGMFLWAALMLQELRSQATTKPKAIRQILRSLPRGLPALYATILGKIPPGRRNDAKTILRWVVWAVRPMHLRELGVAIAVTPEHTSIASLQEDMESDLAKILQLLFGSLLRVQDDGTVHLRHQSTKEFLSTTEQVGEEYNCVIAPLLESNRQIATDCLTYLSFDEFECGPRISSHGMHWRGHPSMEEKYTFLGYAARYWPEHMEASGRKGEESSDLEAALLRVAASSRKLNLAFQVYCHSREESFTYTPSLQIAAYLGLEWFAKVLLQKGDNVNEKSRKLGYALHAAALNGHEGMVVLLLNSGADINAIGGRHSSAVAAASYSGHPSMVKLLIDKGCDVNAECETNGYPIQVAASCGRFDVVNVLLDNGADVNAVGGRLHSTALQVSIVHQNEDMVRLLLDRGADVNARENISQGRRGNVLQAAAATGNETILRLLLERGADVNGPACPLYGTALVKAASRGHVPIVQLLLDHGAKINYQRKYEIFTGRNALQAAAKGGDETLVQLLLDRGADIHAQAPTNDHDCRSPLTIAARNGRETVISLLLDHGVDINTRADDNFGSALREAALMGQTDSVRLLLARGADPNAVGKSGRTALVAAAFAGHQIDAQVLMEGGAHIDGVLNDALQAAVWSRDQDTVRWLLKLGADVNYPGGEFGSALLVAVILTTRDGGGAVVQALLEHGASVNGPFNAPDDRILKLNIWCGNWQLCEFLSHEASNEELQHCSSGPSSLLETERYIDRKSSERGASDRGIDVSIPGVLGNGLLPIAASIGNGKVVQMLIDNGADVNAMGGPHCNALQAAVYRRHEAVARVLVKHGADVNVQCKFGTALQTAAHKVLKPDLIQLLIENGADVNLEGPKYGSALHAAVSAISRHYGESGQKENLERIQLLIDNGSNVNAEGGPHGSVLRAAVHSGVKSAVRLLLKNGADVRATSGKHRSTALHAAAGSEDEALIRSILDQGPDIDALGGEHASSTLYDATALGNCVMVRLLIEKGADVNSRGGEFGTPLQVAVRGKSESVTRLLIDHGANLPGIKCENQSGNALSWFAAQNNEDMVRLLIKTGADVNAESDLEDDFPNALQAAAFNSPENTTSIVQLLLDSGANVNAQPGGKYITALRAAVYGGNQAVVQLLIDNGADINAHFGAIYGTALQGAAWLGAEDMARLLLKNGADTSVQGGVNGNPLQAAAYMGKEALVKLLLASGADINAYSDTTHITALRAAVYGGHRSIVQLLIDSGADIDAHAGETYGTALQGAAYLGMREITQQLLDNGADPNVQGGISHTPLQAACYRGNETEAFLLMDGGAVVNLQGGKFGNALQAAVHAGLLEVVKRLLDRGVDVNAHGGHYGFPLWAAVEKGHLEIARLLLDRGAYVRANDGVDATALSIERAKEAGNDAIVRLLQNHFEARKRKTFRVNGDF